MTLCTYHSTNAFVNSGDVSPQVFTTCSWEIYVTLSKIAQPYQILHNSLVVCASEEFVYLFAVELLRVFVFGEDLKCEESLL